VTNLPMRPKPLIAVGMAINFELMRPALLVGMNADGELKDAAPSTMSAKMIAKDVCFVK
jgi:hypothetical protein